MKSLYQAYNGAMPTTAALTPITTGTAIKTLLQIATPSTLQLEVVAWGIDFDGSPSAIKCELVETDVAATVTAHVAAGIIKVSEPTALASNVTLGTSATGYTATAEGTTTATRIADYHILTANTYSYEWSLGRSFVVGASKFLRVRVTAAAAVNAVCWVRWEE